jgi:GT2 family glycosyltransferase
MASLAAFVMTFDRPQILRHTAETLLAQSRPPEVVLVLDNGSNSETRAVIDGLADDRVRYHSIGGNSGPAGAAAYGLQQLCDEGYDWIYWGDDDDPPKTPDTENSPANGTSASVARLMSGS